MINFSEQIRTGENCAADIDFFLISFISSSSDAIRRQFPYLSLTAEHPPVVH